MIYLKICVLKIAWFGNNISDNISITKNIDIAPSSSTYSVKVVCAETLHVF